jgi:glycosyltransferase involved in cell wall biosynthesis
MGLPSMTVESRPKVALVYDDDAYVEAGGRALGLMGRQVAGRAFLEAYLRHGTFSELTALVQHRTAAESLARIWREHAALWSESRVLRVVERAELYQALFPAAAAAIVHAPQPPDPNLAWARQQGGPHAFALSGVTHTLCSLEAVALLRSLVTAPFESYDALICTSRAVAQMVREVTGAYAEDLRSRLGSSSECSSLCPIRARLETIPLGVDLDRFSPASPAERVLARQSFGIADDEVVLLYVGRLSHHGKAHPFPMFQGASQAAQATGRKVHLILAGWAAHPAVQEAFLDGARVFAGNVRTSIVDGRDTQTRRRIWHAADLFVSPSDSIQETFGLAVLEAMSSGLAVVASDWDGYRDLVEHGQTGFLVPSAMVEGATAAATVRLLIGELSYDHFLAECSQATAVLAPDMGEALARLVGDAALRAQMGAAGRRRAGEHFGWPSIVRAYEQLWYNQEAERRAQARDAARSGPRRKPAAPAIYPPPERSFVGYPTRRLAATDRVVPAPQAVATLDTLLEMPLVHHASARRAATPGLLRAALAEAPCTVEHLDGFWARSSIELGRGRATLAWMLKYDLLRAAAADRPEGGPKHEHAPS